MPFPVTVSKVMEAAKLANAHDFIESFPAGYGTVLGERGVTVSGVQKQRLAIARALVKSPAILILDEATWHLGYLDVKAGDWLLCRSVLIPTRWIESVSWADCRINLHHCRDGI